MQVEPSVTNGRQDRSIEKRARTSARMQELTAKVQQLDATVASQYDSIDTLHRNQQQLAADNASILHALGMNQTANADSADSVDSDVPVPDVRAEIQNPQ